MHVHVAVFQWKPEVTAQQVEEALNLVRSVANRVPDLVGVYCGPNTSKWADKYLKSDVVVVVGKTAESIANYRADAVHVEAAKLIEEMEAVGIGLDFADNMS